MIVYCTVFTNSFHINQQIHDNPLVIPALNSYFLCCLSNQHLLGAVRELNEELWVVIAHPHIVD